MDQFSELSIEIVSAFKKRNQKNLRKLNDRILKIAVLEFNEITYDLAVISYILSKIVSKPRFFDPKFSEQVKTIEVDLSLLAKSSSQPESWLKIYSKLESDILNLENDDPRFLTNLVSKGKLKVAATLYAQGLSLGIASDYTGISKQDILDYAGKTMMFDRVKEEKSITERLKVARNFLMS